MNELLEKVDFTQSPILIKAQILALPIIEQDFQIALWIVKDLDILEEMRYRPLPTPPPKYLNDFIKLNYIARKKLNENTSDLFWKDKSVIAYLDERERIRGLNWRNLKELKWVKEILKEHADLILLIDEKINGFIDIEEHPEPINKPDAHWQD